MEKRLLFAALLSLAVLVLWEWIGPKPPRRPATVPVAPPTAQPESAVSPVPSPVSAPAAPSDLRIAGTREGLTTIENSVARATFSNRGAVLSSFVLLKHTDEQRRPLELVRALPDAAARPLALDFPGRADLTKVAAGALYAVEKGPDRSVTFRYADERLQVEKGVRLSDGYLFDVRVSAAGAPYTLLVGPGLRNPTEKERASSYVMPPTGVATVDGSIERFAPGKLEKEESWTLPQNGFAGIEDNYFLAALAPRQPAAARVFPVAAAPPAGEAAGKPEALVAVGVTATGPLEARAYFGPKDVEILEGLQLGLERTVDFGWFGILARPLLWLLKKTYAWSGNYGLAILLVTLLVRILIFPLMHKS
ncbi:MAG: membrane protein insertase YidC, partial [Thermoanaerobaculia bacterium]